MACIKNGASINVQGENGMTSLMLACLNNQPNLVRDLLNAGADITVQNNKGRTAIHYAITNYDIMVLMIRAGVNLNYQDANGDTIVNYWLKKMHVRPNRNYNIFLLLLRGGTDCNICDNNGQTPLIILAKLYDNWQPGFTDILRFIKTLFEYHADPNQVDNTGSTSLMYFIVRSEYVDYGPIGSIDGANGTTSIKSILNFLLTKNINLNIKNNEGITAAISLVKNNIQNLIIITKLIQYKSVCEDCDSNGNTLLMLYSNNPNDSFNLQVIRLLIDVSNVNTQNKSGKTALMIFLSRFLFEENCSVLEKLISASDLSIRDKNNNSTYDFFISNQSHKRFTNEKLIHLLENVQITKSASNI